MYLDKILEKHRSAASVDARKLSDLTRQAKSCQATRGFALRLKRDSENQLAVIAEIKRRSPSRGALNHELNPTDIAMQYRNGGASCLSVLTDEEFLVDQSVIYSRLASLLTCQFCEKISLSQ